MPRAGLNREKIAAQAAAVADETGLDRLTLAAVAQRCGVSLPGLYKHVDGLDAVKRDIAVIGVRELTAVLAEAAAGLAGRDALHAIADAYRRFAKEHPGRHAASAWAPAPGDEEHQAAGAAAVGVLAAVLKGYRIEGDDMIDAVRMMRASLYGFVALEAAGGFGLPQSVDATFERYIDTLDTAWSTWRRLRCERDDSAGPGRTAGADGGQPRGGLADDRRGNPGRGHRQPLRRPPGPGAFAGHADRRAARPG